MNLDKKHDSDSKLRMGFPYAVGISNYDPAFITSIYHCTILRSLYGRLVRYNQDGLIVPDLAENFYWKDNNLFFEFGKKVLSFDGNMITAEDAAASLKRSIIFKRTGHGDLRNFLCPGKELHHIDDECEGIEVVDQKLILKPKKLHYGPTLLTALENVDYSIIPKKTLNKSLKIVDYKNTSGPYFVGTDSDNGELKLQANTKHYLYSDKMPQEINLVPIVENNNIWDMYLSGKIDFISTGMLTLGTSANSVLSDKIDNSVHESIPISVQMLIFSSEAIKIFTAEQRVFVGNIILEVVKNKLKLYDAQPTESFFTQNSNGGLSVYQELELKNRRSSHQRPTFERPIEIGVSETRVEFLRGSLLDYKKEIKIVALKKSSIELKINERPHGIIFSNDSSWLEDLGLISYNLNQEIFKTTDMNKDQWIENYLNKEDKADRNKMLQDLHYENLINAYIYPLLISPYFAVIKKPWVFNMSTLYAGTELWNIRTP